MRTQPCETAPPIRSGRFVPWMAIGPPWIQSWSTGEKAEMPSAAGPERAGRVRGDQALVHVVAARRRRRVRRTDRQRRDAEHLATSPVQRQAAFREVDLEARVHSHGRTSAARTHLSMPFGRVGSRTGSVARAALPGRERRRRSERR